MFATMTRIGATYASIREEHGMAFTYKNRKGDTYYLNTQKVTLQNGREQQIYFFSRDQRQTTGLDAVPSGYEVSERADSGLPVLRKQK